MSVEIRKILLTDLPVLKNIFQLYLYDMSKFVELELSNDGKFDFDQNIIDAYFKEPQHYPYFIIHDEKVAGFALIRQYPHDMDVIDMGQFFVLGQHTRQNIGQNALEICLKRHPGHWQIRVLQKNIIAQKFWKKAVSNLTNDTYKTQISDHQGTAMTFISFSK